MIATFKTFQAPKGMVRKYRQVSCPIHGLFEQGYWIIGGVEQEGSVCPECKKIAHAEQARLDAQYRIDALRAKKEAEIAASIGRSGIPADFLHKCFESYTPHNESQRKALELSKRFVRGWDKARAGGWGLIYFGNCGTGKSHLAISAMRELIEQRGIGGLYVRTADIVRRVRATWRTGSGESEMDAVRFFADVDLLIIDELGVQIGSASEQQTLFSVIDERISNARPTIFITNLAPNELVGVLGERIVDRIKGKSVSCRILGSSYRTQPSADVFGD